MFTRTEKESETRRKVWAWDDSELAAAFTRLLAEPSFSKIDLSDWAFRLAADAPGVFARYGGFTWKQRKYLREIAEKVINMGTFEPDNSVVQRLVCFERASSGPWTRVVVYARSINVPASQSARDALFAEIAAEAVECIAIAVWTED